MCLVEPGAFREIHSFVQKSCEGSGRLEVISLAAIGEWASHIDIYPNKVPLTGSPHKSIA